MNDALLRQPAPTLVDRERVKRSIGQTSFTAKEQKLIDGLIRSVSVAVQQYCRREFAAQQYDELYHGQDVSGLVLRNSPILEVTRVAYAPTSVLTVQNTSASNQRASVQVTSSGVKLIRVASGVYTVDESITYEMNATMAAIAASINALGNGWTATANSTYVNWAADDLRALQGAFACRDAPAYLKSHVAELSGWNCDEDAGILYREESSFDPSAWLTNLDYFGPLPIGGSWSGGRNWWRVVYTAGFAETPEPVQEAVSEWVTDCFWAAKERPVQVGELLPTSHVRFLLNPYRRNCI